MRLFILTAVLCALVLPSVLGKQLPHMLRTSGNARQYPGSQQAVSRDSASRVEGQSEEEEDWTIKVPEDPDDRAYKVMCYYPNWAQYRPVPYTVYDIDPFLCSHVHFAFADIDDYTVRPYEYNDFEMYAALNALRDDVNPSLRTLLSVGGASESSADWQRVSSTAQARELFVANTVHYTREHGFNGLDLDWEYPNTPAEGGDLVLLLEEFRRHINMESSRTGQEPLILSVALGISDHLIYTVYDIPGIARYVDFAAVMSYNMHGSWEPVTGFHSALYSSLSTDCDNQECVVLKFIGEGFPAAKLILGVPTYGHNFILCHPDHHYVGAPACGSGDPPTVPYNEICYKILTGHIREYDKTQEAPYVHAGSEWIGYEDAWSVRAKRKYVLKEGLGGLMFWDLSMDDFYNKCGDGNYPVISAGAPPGVPSSTRPTGRPTPPTPRTTTTTTTTTSPIPSRTPPTATSTSTTATTTTTITVPPGDCNVPPACNYDGEMLPHPCDCTAFYQCHAGVAHLFFCQGDLYFDPEINVCNYPDLVHCTPHTV